MLFEQWILLILSTAGSVVGALWVVAKVIIPRIVEARIKAAEDEREYRQEQEEREWESRAQAQATRDLRQIQVENQALAIAKENIQWAREDFSVMQRTVEQQARLLENIRREILILAGAVARLGDEVEEIKLRVEPGSKSQTTPPGAKRG